MKSLVAVVPARRGSKGLPNKNVSLIFNETLVERAVRIASESDLFRKIIVTSDYSPQELRIVTNDLVCFHVRAHAAALDSATALDVLRDLNDCDECRHILQDSILCYLQPTSPLRTSSDICESFFLMRDNGFARVISVLEKPIQTEKLMRSVEGGVTLVETHTGLSSHNRQELGQKSFMPNGAIYWFDSGDIETATSFPVQDAAAYPMSWVKSIDVDSLHDLFEVRAVLGDQNE
jgi:CMP-N-acetylneuraminic acid synthetase